MSFFEEDEKFLQENLFISLVTYNRKDYLKRTLDKLLEDSSPLRNVDITILDNASDDGSSELIDEYCLKYSTLVHIKHNIKDPSQEQSPYLQPSPRHQAMHT